MNIPKDFRPEPDLLRNRIILVTGATGGFGRVASLACAAHGATVILLAKNLRLVEGLYDEIEQAGYPTPAIYPINLEGATEHDYSELRDNIEKEFGRLDGLVHCAAALGAPTAFEHSDAETWYRVHQVNLHAPYLLTRSVLPIMKTASQASIVFMTDDKTGAYWDAYMVSKKALDGMAELLAREYEGGHVRINRFNPGKTRTPLQVRAFPAADENDSLPPPEAHRDVFLYLMREGLVEHGECFEGCSPG